MNPVHSSLPPFFAALAHFHAMMKPPKERLLQRGANVRVQVNLCRRGCATQAAGRQAFYLAHRQTAASGPLRIALAKLRVGDGEERPSETGGQLSFLNPLLNLRFKF